MYRNVSKCIDGVSLHKVFVDTFRYICIEMYRDVSRCIEAYRWFSFFRFEITIICNSERSTCIQSKAILDFWLFLTSVF